MKLIFKNEKKYQNDCRKENIEIEACMSFKIFNIYKNEGDCGNQKHEIEEQFTGRFHGGDIKKL